MTVEHNRRRTWRLPLAALGLAMLIFIGAACSSSNEAATPAAVSDPSPVADPAPSGDFKAGDASLVIYSGRSESLVGPIIERFEKETGIDVKVRYGSTGALVATLLEEGDRTPADVFFAQDPGGLGAVIDRLDVLPQDILDRVPDWARSPQGKWVGISGRARVVVYNTEDVSPADLPGTLEGFTDPKWKGRIGWAPANGSFQAMVTGMRILWGEQRTQAWLEGIMANNPREYPKNTPIVAAAGSGEIDVGFVNHYYLHRFLAEEGEGFDARNYFLSDGGPGSVVLVAGAGILSTATNGSAAERFLDYMLSPDAQSYFAEETFEYPLIDGVPRAKLLPAIDTLNTPDIDVSRLGDLEATQNLLRKVGALP